MVARRKNDTKEEYLERARLENRAWYARQNKEDRYKRVRTRRLTDPQRTLWELAYQRARVKNIPFNIEVSDIFIPKFCPVLGILLVIGNRGQGYDSPSLDRIIPELGYVKGNIAVISWRANNLKRDATLEELKAVVSWFENNKPSVIEIPAVGYKAVFTWEVTK